MNKKNLFITILIVLTILYSSSIVFAHDNNVITNTNDELQLQENSNINEIIQSSEDVKLSTDYDITVGSDSESIQNTINNMNSGDILNFEKGTYNNISIYVDKSITINGNGAQLIGYENPNENTTSNKITNPTPSGGYGIGTYATLYIVNTSNVVIKGLTIIGQNPAYGQASIYADKVTNLTIEKSTIEGGYWGIYLNGCSDGTVTGNTVQNQEATGILNFGSAKTVISNNTVINAKNHGIDARHGTGPNVQVINNTINGAKEGIYLMHSKGHSVYENKITNYKISAITAYGSGNENIFNNTIGSGRLYFLLGGGYYNVTIGNNYYPSSSMYYPFPPTFREFIAQADSKFQSADNVVGLYSTNTTTILTSENLNLSSTKGIIEVTLKDGNGNAIYNEEITLTLNNEKYYAKTDSDGKASYEFNTEEGVNTATFTYDGRSNLLNSKTTALINVTLNMTKIISQTVTKIYNINKNLVLSLKDVNGNNLANKTVTITINNVNYNKITNSNGEATLALTNLAAKTYIAQIKFAGDEEFKSTSLNGNVIVKKATPILTAKAKTFKVKTKTKKYTITLKTNTNAKLKNTKVTLKVNGKTYSSKTNANGQATFKITKLTKKGKYTATIKSAKTSNYNAVTKKVKLTIKK